MQCRWCGAGIAGSSKHTVAGWLPADMTTSAPTANERAVKPMLDDCKWMQDEVCVNADCPACADYCPVANYPGVCKYEERGDFDAQES